MGTALRPIDQQTLTTRYTHNRGGGVHSFCFESAPPLRFIHPCSFIAPMFTHLLRCKQTHVLVPPQTRALTVGESRRTPSAQGVARTQARTCCSSSRSSSVVAIFSLESSDVKICRKWSREWLNRLKSSVKRCRIVCWCQITLCGPERCSRSHTASINIVGRRPLGARE